MASHRTPSVPWVSIPRFGGPPGKGELSESIVVCCQFLVSTSQAWFHHSSSLLITTSSEYGYPARPITLITYSFHLLHKVYVEFSKTVDLARKSFSCLRTKCTSNYELSTTVTQLKCPIHFYGVDLIGKRINYAFLILHKPLNVHSILSLSPNRSKAGRIIFLGSFRAKFPIF